MIEVALDLGAMRAISGLEVFSATSQKLECPFQGGSRCLLGYSRSHMAIQRLSRVFWRHVLGRGRRPWGWG